MSNILTQVFLIMLLLKVAYLLRKYLFFELILIFLGSVVCFRHTRLQRIHLNSKENAISKSRFDIKRAVSKSALRFVGLQIL